jgi:hypothetical protein
MAPADGVGLTADTAFTGLPRDHDSGGGKRTVALAAFGQSATWFTIVATFPPLSTTPLPGPCQLCRQMVDIRSPGSPVMKR